MPANEELQPTVLLPKDKFVELNTIAADSELAAYLDAIATDNVIIENILKITGKENLQYRDGQILVPEDEEI